MSFQPLTSQISYTHSWDLFSRYLFLDASSKNNSSLLHILSDEIAANKYQTISKEFWNNYFPLSTYHDLIDLLQTKGNIYSIPIEYLTWWLDENILHSPLQVTPWDIYNMDDFVKKLIELEYEFSEYEKPNSFFKNWDIVSIYTSRWNSIRVSFWWDEIEELIFEKKKIPNITLWSLKKLFSDEKTDTTLWNYIWKKNTLCVWDNIDFHSLYEEIHSYLPTLSSFDTIANSYQDKTHIRHPISSAYISNIEELKEILESKNIMSKIYTRHAGVLSEFLKNNNLWHIEVCNVRTHLLTSFRYEREPWKQELYICDDVLSKIFIKKRVKKRLSADIDLLLKIQNGDFVVHIDHGIWIFKGIIKKEIGNISKEYMEISYEKNEKLFVPITEVHRVSKYIWSENPKLTPLSGKLWEKKMKKINEDIREIAQGILESFAERKLREWEKNIFYQEEIQKFQEKFPYVYTQDQENSILEIFSDMQSTKNMDRLIVGDVWFWKTEIAFNAAYLSLINKKQVLLISPLVVLAHEHYEKAKERFTGFWIKIEILTRLQSQKHASLVIQKLKKWDIDMVIWTHRLLSEKIQCRNLWLMIIDEEHKFWVVDKEKIKKFRSNIDILSLSATPIPRSLNLALSGVRDISLLKTAPKWRKSIETSVIRYNEKVIFEAGRREFARGGQIFFVHNRVSNIQVVKKQLESLFTGKKIAITHGQLPGEELENRIIDFKNKKYDILLSTTVIENGIDFSNVNTIFINECQSFWISQIHQLRGRVWRSLQQWYCYLLYKKENLDWQAARRIQTIVDYSYLWAGFELAMKDLEIRWWWDILGVRQSGQAQEIWVSLFLKMLEEKIQELQNEQKSDSKNIQKNKIKASMDLMITAGIPDNYFLNETDKLNFYREIELIEDIDDLEYLKDSFLKNSFQDIPEETQSFFLLLEVQIWASIYKVSCIKRSGINYQIDFDTSSTLDDIKKFLSLDQDILFHVVDATRIRCNTKGFANDKLFIKYLLHLLQGKIWNPKIQLVKKKVNIT